MESFKEWLERRYGNDDSPKGKLAKDVRGDSHFPKRNKRKAIESYLEKAGAVPECIKTFNECFDSYLVGRKP